MSRFLWRTTVGVFLRKMFLKYSTCFVEHQEDTEGTGLGLYIVKEALNKIKGIIFVDSELGKGK